MFNPDFNVSWIHVEIL